MSLGMKFKAPMQVTDVYFYFVFNVFLRKYQTYKSTENNIMNLHVLISHFNKYPLMATLVLSFPPQAPDYFKSNPRYYTISSVNILVCNLKR